MPLPLIPIAIVLAVAALAGGGYYLKKLKDKTVVIAGRPESGKTVLAHFLANGEKPSMVPKKSTMYSEKFVVKGKNKITAVIDCRHHDRAKQYGRDDDTYDKEIEDIKKSDAVLFLCDLNEIYNNPRIEGGNSKDYRDATNTELEIFSGFCSKFEKPLILVGTHLDKIEGFDNSKSLQDNTCLMKKIEKKYVFPKKIIPVALTDKYIEESGESISKEVDQNIK